MRLATICAAFGYLVFGAIAQASAAEPYVLGPGDRVEIRVSDFRSGLGEAYQWPIFSQPNEDFVVGPDGRLSVPVIGAVDAGGRTTADVAAEIVSRLQSRAGLTTRPDVSVQIVRFRPIYVTGAVDKPGEYDFRPGLTVLQAVSIAGGLQRLTSDVFLGLEKDALNARGDLRVLEADRVSLLARQARIDAEAHDRNSIEFPKELISGGDPGAARAMREEQILFDAQRSGLKKQTAALEQNKKYLAGEIDRLRQKSDTIAQGLAATQKEYDLFSSLVKKGLTARPRQLELEQNLAQIQSNQLDVEVAIVRANEDIARSDRDLSDISTKFGADLIQEAQDVRVKLDETVEKIETARQMVQQSEVRAPMLLQATLDAAERPTYTIAHRRGDGKIEESPAGETDGVQPGDVVRVIIKQGLSSQAAEAPPGPKF
jgi:protein involved in polysaccharide export with SLBB domain